MSGRIRALKLSRAWWAVDQDVVVDPVKALGQVSTSTTTRLRDWTQASRGIDRIKGSPVGAKPVAVFDEAGVDPGLQHLQPCLRDQSISHRGNAQFALAPVGLGKHHSGYRTGPVRAHQQRWADLGSMGAYGRGGLPDIESVCLGGTLARTSCFVTGGVWPSFTVPPSCPLALLGCAFCAVLFIGSRLMLRAWPIPHSVALTQLRHTESHCDQLAAGLAPAGVRPCLGAHEKTLLNC